MLRISSTAEPASISNIGLWSFVRPNLIRETKFENLNYESCSCFCVILFIGDGCNMIIRTCVSLASFAKLCRILLFFLLGQPLKTMRAHTHTKQHSSLESNVLRPKKNFRVGFRNQQGVVVESWFPVPGNRPRSPVQSVLDEESNNNHRGTSRDTSTSLKTRDTIAISRLLSLRIRIETCLNICCLLRPPKCSR